MKRHETEKPHGHGPAVAEEEPEQPPQPEPAEPHTAQQQEQQPQAGRMGLVTPAAGLASPAPLVFPPPVTLPIFPPLGYTPTSIAQIVANGGGRATRFSGPLVSGPPLPFVAGPTGANAAAGSALLALILRVDASMGGFSLPIPFPQDAIPLWLLQVTTTAFTGGTGTAPTVALGSVANGVDILAATAATTGATTTLGTTKLTPITNTLPLPGTPAGKAYQAYFTVVQGTATAGASLAILIFARCPVSWF